jgi:C4-dicarboxylate-specific signal transduction histidine kinase
MQPYRQPGRRATARRQRPNPLFPPAVVRPLLAHSSDSLLLIDNRHLIRALNPAACILLGLSSASARGRDWRRFFRAPPLPRQPDPVLQCLRTGCHQELGAALRLAQGDARIAMAGKVLALTAGRRPLALLCLQPGTAPESPSMDMRNEHELLLQHVSRLNTVSELATGIAHEMNQPLSAIMSFNQAALRLLAAETPDLDRVAEALAETVNQTRRAAGILERLRAFVGRQNLAVEPVALNQVVINALTLLSSKLAAAGVRVSLHTEPCPPVRADALQLEQVMVNLVRNAVEAMRECPADARELKVHTQSFGERVHVSVTDSGPGLPPGLEEQLFTRFFTTKSDGMGLGLSISRTIVEAAGGELGAATAPEGGACFRFSLPVFVAEEIGHGHFAV